MNETQVVGTTEEVLADEIRHSDEHYAPFARDLAMHPVMWDKYARPVDLWDYRQLTAVLLGDLRGKRLLDLGCGMGEELIYFAQLGAHATGIDISPTGVEIARRRAEHNGVAANVEAFLMSATPTQFAADTFDIVHGLGILHHIGVDHGLGEVHRILKPGGLAVFYEPIGDCPWVEATKEWLMSHARFLGFAEVTEHEQNLRFQDIERAGARFAEMQIYPFHLLYRAKRLVPGIARDLLRKVDSGLLAVVPALRHYAGAVVVRLRK